MYKYKKIYICSVLISFMIFFYIYCSIGNYAYNLFFNREASHQMNDFIYMSTDHKQSAKDWYNKYGTDVQIVSDDGLTLKGSYIKQNSSICILCVHGYRNDKYNMLKQVQMFKGYGYDVLAVDLRGHGSSEGSYISMGIKEIDDLRLWIKLIQSYNKDYKIVLYGVSMGASCILRLADQHLDITCIIADSPYSDLEEVLDEYAKLSIIEKYVLLGSLRFISLYRGGFDIYDLSPSSFVSESYIPILYLHSYEDQLIPLKQVIDLYHMTYSYKDIKIYGGKHGECFKENGYFKDIYSFIESI